MSWGKCCLAETTTKIADFSLKQNYEALYGRLHRKETRASLQTLLMLEFPFSVIFERAVRCIDVFLIDGEAETQRC